MLIYPTDIISNGSECCVIFAIFNDKACDAMLFPSAIASSANIWSSAVTSASICWAAFPKASAHHIPSVEAVIGANSWQHCLLKGVMGGSRVLD